MATKPNKRGSADDDELELEDDDELDDDDLEDEDIDDEEDDETEDEDDDTDDDDATGKKRRAAKKPAGKQAKSGDKKRFPDEPEWAKRRRERALREQERKILDELGFTTLAAAKAALAGDDAEDEDDEDETPTRTKTKAKKPDKQAPVADRATLRKLRELEKERDDAKKVAAQAEAKRVNSSRNRLIERVAAKAGALSPVAVRALANEDYPNMVDDVLSVDDKSEAADVKAARRLVKRMRADYPDMFGETDEDSGDGIGSPSNNGGRLTAMNSKRREAEEVDTFKRFRG